MTKAVVAFFALVLILSERDPRISPSRFAQAPQFVSHEIARGLTGGYQVIAADLNRDGKPDLIAVSDLPELVWFENPSWKRHVLTRGLIAVINVAAADIDGDGIPEIAVASGFSTRPDQSSGNIAILTHGTDPTQPWTVREIDRNPAAHRLRWYVDRDGQRWLMDAPLSSATAKPPNYDGPTPIYAYRAPDWKRELVTSEEFGVVHAIEPIHSLFCDACLLTAGFAGIHRYEQINGAWTHSAVVAGHPAPVPKGGSSDIAVGRMSATTASSNDYFLAAIEPWHGNEVVIYRRSATGSFVRQVIDTTVVDGHTLVTADLDGDGVDEVIVGQRGGSRSVWAYTNSSSGAWTRTTLDDGGMAGAGCVAVDLNADSRIDIACIGTATANLKWYENQASARRDYGLRGASETTTVDVARSSFTRAVTVVEPCETAVTRPVESTTATLGLDDVHSTPLGVLTDRPIDVAANVSATDFVVGTIPPMKIVATDGDNFSARPGGANGSVSESLEQAMHDSTIANLVSTDRAARI